MLKFTASFLITAAIVTLSNAAIADSLVSNGGGGDYNYQIWRSTDNTEYYLKIWNRQAYPNGNPLRTTQSFKSTREALDYFDCYYAEKPLQVCAYL